MLLQYWCSARKSTGKRFTVSVFEDHRWVGLDGWLARFFLFTLANLFVAAPNSRPLKIYLNYCPTTGPSPIPNIGKSLKLDEKKGTCSS